MKIKVKGTEVILPDGWNEVSFGMYLQLRKNWHFDDIVTMLSVLTNTKLELWEDTAVWEFEENIQPFLQWVISDKPELDKLPTPDGLRIKGEFVTIDTDVENMPFAFKYKATNILEGNVNDAVSCFHEMLAVYGKVEAEDILNCPVLEVYPLGKKLLNELAKSNGYFAPEKKSYNYWWLPKWLIPVWAWSMKKLKR